MANLNDKLISYGNLAEFHIKLLNDSSVSNKATWSSQKISAMIADAGFAVEIVAELPATGDPHTIYFVPSSNPETSNIKDEFMYINGAWEQVGSTAIDLTPYATKAELNSDLALKADKSYVDSSLALKADLSYVDASLALKADVYEVATTADIEALFASAPTAPADNEIWYTTSNNELWEPYDEELEGDMLEIYPNNPSLRNHLLSNTYENGHGVLKYANNVTTLPEAWGKTDSMHPSQLTTLTLPHSVSFVGDICSGNPNLNTVYYNGTVAECGEINFDYFGQYADFDINQIICLDGIYDL